MSKAKAGLYVALWLVVLLAFAALIGCGDSGRASSGSGQEELDPITVYFCHNPGPNQETYFARKSEDTPEARQEHIDHGDYAGFCQDSTL